MSFAAAALVASTLLQAPSVPGAGAAANGVTEYPLVTQATRSNDIALGPDGALWLAATNTNQIIRMTTTGEVTEFEVPTAGSGPMSITAGPDGNLWFTENAGNQIGRITTGGEITEFPVPTADSGPWGIAAGPDGNLWFTQNAANQVGQITTAGVVTEFAGGECVEQPHGIAAGSDGALWVAARGCGGAVASISTSGVFGTKAALPNGGDPFDITAGPDGNLWFTELSTSRIGRVTTAGVLTEFPVPTATSRLAGITAGPDGNIWFAEDEANQIGRATPDGVITEFLLPTPAVRPFGMAGETAPGGRVWFTELDTDRIGAIVTGAVPLPRVESVSPDHAGPEAGTELTITGVGFTGATDVVFTISVNDGASWAAQSFTVDSDTQITAVTPELEGFVYDVRVVTPGGRSAVVAGDRYTTVKALTVTSVEPASGSPLEPTVGVRIFGTGFASATAVHFGALEGSDLLIGSDFDLTVTAPAQASGTVADVTVTTPYGTSPVVPEATFTYRYEPVPFQITPDSAPAAGGTPAVLSGAGFLGATAVTFGDVTLTCPGQCTVVSGTEINLVVPPHAIGGVKVRVTAPDGASPTGPRFAFTGVGGFSPAGVCPNACFRNGMVQLPSGKILGVNSTTSSLYDPMTGVRTAAGTCTACADFSLVLTLLPSGPPAVCGDNCGKVLAIGRTSASLYDPQANTWAPTAGPPATPSTAFGHDAPVLMGNGKVLSIRNSSTLFFAQLFDPLTGTFALTGAPVRRHSSHAATLLADGRVLVSGSGGQFGGALSRAAEVYNPANGTWTETGQMNQGRFAHTSTLLKDGRVLVTGGQIGFGAPIVSSEIWNPATGTWTPTADMVFERSDHAASLLPDGRVLAIGGDVPTEDPVSGNPIGHRPTIGEIYDPAIQQWSPTVAPGLHLGDNNFFSQTYNARSVVLPAGPASLCGVRCGQVLVVRGDDIALQVPIPRAPSAVFFAPPPRASFSPASGPAEGGTSLTLTGTGLASVSGVSFGGVPATSVTPDPATPDTKVTVVTPARIAGAVDVVVTTAGGAVIAGRFTFQAPAAPAPGPSPSPSPAATVPTSPGSAPVLSGYAMAAADGGVFNFGSLPFAGSLGGARLNQPIAAIEHTPSGKGYWLAGADGGVFAFGDALFKGSTGGIRLAKPIVDIVGTPSGAGYWLIGSDGGVFAFGDAVYKGSTGAIRLNAPVVAAERSASGGGYWLVASDGGVFGFGDAAYKGSTGSIRLAQPVVTATRSAGGAGYWLAAADGGVFAFGDAVFHGSTGAIRLNSPIVGSAGASSGSGYVLCARDGGAFAFGAAGFAGSMGGTRLNSPVTACSGPRPPGT